MEFTVKYRSQGGRVDYEIVQANSRSEAFSILKDKGIVAISITEGGTHCHRPKKAFPSRLIKISLIGLLLPVAIWLYFTLFNTSNNLKSKPVKATANRDAKLAIAPKGKPTQKPQFNSATNSIQTPKESKPAIDTKVKLDFTAMTNAHGEVMERWRTPDGKTHARLVPPKPLFDNVIDQTLSLVLSVPKGHTLPPMPGLGPNATKEFAEALKKPIVINEDDPEDVKRAKLLVQAGREAIFDQLETGKSVNEIIAEHCAAVNDNAELHNTVNSEYRKLLAEGDLEGAETYRQEANKILEKSGAEPVQQHGSTSRRKSQQKGSN